MENAFKVRRIEGRTRTTEHWRSHKFRRLDALRYAHASNTFGPYAVKTGAIVVAKVSEYEITLCRVLGQVEFPDGLTGLSVLAWFPNTVSLHRRILKQGDIFTVLSTDGADWCASKVRATLTALLGALPDYDTIAAMEEYGALAHCDEHADTSGNLPNVWPVKP